MSDKKQTATDYLIQEIKNDALVQAKSTKEWNEVFRKAKQMEREQMAGIFISGSFNREKPFTFLEYYNDTYGKTKN